MEKLKPAALAASIAHYSPGIKHNGVIYVSGQLPFNTEGNVAEGIIDQTRQCLENISVILKEGSSNLSQILKLNIFISDIAYWPDVNTVVAEMLGDHKPARIVVPVGLLDYGCLVEIDAVAIGD